MISTETNNVSMLSTDMPPPINQRISVLSWNIHDIKRKVDGLKTKEKEFLAIAKNNLIVCLQETKRSVKLPDYRCFNKLRKGSRSGGLCMGIHKSLAKQAKEIETKSEDIQVVSINVGPKTSGKTITIVNVYDSPDASSYKKKRRAVQNSITTLEELIEIFNENPQIQNCMMLGDFNARTGNLNHTFVNQNGEENEDFSSCPTECDRVSMDSLINKRGKLLMDLLACRNLSILNGNTVGDLFGEFTCHNYKGSSVVDYIAVGPDIHQNVCYFNVSSLTPLSDHKPLTCVLDISHCYNTGEELLEALESCPQKYVWNNQSTVTHEKFLSEQKCPIFRERAESLINYQCHSSENVMELNKEITKLFHDVADKVIPRRGAKKNNGKIKKKSHFMKPKKPWFDPECINAKRHTRALAKKYGKSPTNSELRSEYYSYKKHYTELKKHKKDKFISELSKDIENGNNVNWGRFKKLKNMERGSSELDVYDMINFYSFFKDLYGKPTLSQDRINNLKSTKAPLDESERRMSQVVDSPITKSELLELISKTKRGKAVSEDLISNEFLKAAGPEMLNAILHLFNECLRLGVYPWNTSHVTPLHKKGCPYDPNNYRAIAVSSNLGKIFSGILLQRLINYKSMISPDTPNQLGFCREAQTSDHIFTLSTCIDKYVKESKGKLYSCFVDFAKAFDTVCREALLYKIWQLGIKGNFFRCLEDMYQKSTAKIKLLNRLSAKIDVIVGTEQGHPMSPELFKCYIHGLSEALNNELDCDVPKLGGTDISHLLWADDLILLALNPTSLQKLINILLQYCLDWGLSVNISKTAVMIFNRTGRLLKESSQFMYGETKVPNAREYCYLGITLTLTGSFKTAQHKLRQKGMRAYFSLKSTINFKAFRKVVLFKLFDSLIRPIVTYGCQVWGPETSLFKALSLHPSENNKLLNVAAEDQMELLHLSFIKWSINVGKRTSNAPIWGDTGRLPLVIDMLKQIFTFYKRLKCISETSPNTIVGLAFREQLRLKLSWFKSISKLYFGLTQNNLSTAEVISTADVLREASLRFRESWDTERTANRKLGFYNVIKSEFGLEEYLNMEIKHKEVISLARIRMSAHKLKVETGRYFMNRENNVNRACPVCTNMENATLLSALPYYHPIIEDENHVLLTCPGYHNIRLELEDNIKSLIFADMYQAFKCTTEIAKFVKKIMCKRFPHQHKATKKTKKLVDDTAETDCGAT